MLSKSKYFRQVEEIESRNNIDRSKYQLLFDIAVGNDKLSEGPKVADEILESIFGVPVYKELLIPISFYESEIGKAILIVKFGIYNDETYISDDIVDLTGYSLQYIYKEAQCGNIKGEQRKKVWLFKGKDVDEYMEKKGKRKSKKSNVLYEEKKEEIKSIGFEGEEKYK